MQPFLSAFSVVSSTELYELLVFASIGNDKLLLNIRSILIYYVVILYNYSLAFCSKDTFLLSVFFIADVCAKEKVRV